MSGIGMFEFIILLVDSFVLIGIQCCPAKMENKVDKYLTFKGDIRATGSAG